LDAWQYVFLELRHFSIRTRHPRLKIIPCPSCNHPKTTYHGHYFRQGTHQISKPILVPRFICKSCGATHSILPQGLLFRCRWLPVDRLIIILRLASGQSLYAIAKALGETLYSLRRFASWLKMSIDFIANLAREKGPIEPVSPPATLALPWLTWQQFTHAFSRTLYPNMFARPTLHTIRTG
jgi:transposase-like protein